MGYDGSIRIDTSIDGSGFQGGLKKISSMAGSAIQGITTLIAGASAALGAGALAGVKYNAQMEQYVTSFGTMLGSADKAQAMIGDLKKFAADTPFELTDLAKGAQTLLAFGTAQEKVMPTMKMIGDISQGNKEKFDSLTLAFAQISSTGKLTGQDLLQCINAGFNPLNEISKKTGKSMAELKEDMSKGAISADMVSEAFAQATSEGGQFYKAMEEQSKTFNGQMSTLKDNAMSFIGELTEGFSTSLKDTALPMVNGWLSQMQGAFKSGGLTALSASLGNVIAQALQSMAAQAPSVIKTAVSIIQSFMLGIKQSLPQITATASEILFSLVNGITSLLPTFIETGMAIVIELATSLITMLPLILQTGIDMLLTFINGLVQTLPQLIPVAVDAVLNLINTLVNNIDLLIDAGISLVIAIANGVLSAIPILVEKAPQIISSFISAIIRNFPKVLQAGVDLLCKFKEGFSSLMSSIPSLGLAIVEGLWNGITGAADWLINNVKSWCGTILNSIKSFFGIHSPSKVLANEVGKFLPPGITMGFTDSMPATISNIKKQMSHIVATAKSSISPLADGSLLNMSSISLAGLTPHDMTKYITQMRSAAAQTQSAFTARFAAQADYAALTLSPTAAPATTNVTFNQTNVSPEPLSASQLTRNAQDMLNWQQNKWRLP